MLVFLLQLRWVRAALDAAHKSACLAWRGAAGRQHANAFPPLRRPRGTPGPLQRSNSLGAAPASGGGAGASLPAGPHHLHQQHPQQHRGSYSGTGGLTGLAADRHGGGAAAAGAGGLLMHSHSSASILVAGGVGAAGTGLRASGGALHNSQSLSGAAAASGGGGASGVVLNAAHLSQLAAMVHFMATLEQWVVAQLVHEAWRDMEAGLAAARSLDDVCAAHSEYANTLLRRCFRCEGRGGCRVMGRLHRRLVPGLSPLLYCIGDRNRRSGLPANPAVAICSPGMSGCPRVHTPAPPAASPRRLPGDVDSRNVGGSLRKCLDGALKFANATAAMTGGAAKVRGGALLRLTAAY